MLLFLLLFGHGMDYGSESRKKIKQECKNQLKTIIKQNRIETRNQRDQPKRRNCRCPLAQGSRATGWKTYWTANSLQHDALRVVAISATPRADALAVYFQAFVI